MAVYKRTYRAYSGPLTNPAWRFLVLQHYAFRAVFRSRSLLVGYVACFIAPLGAICALYLNQNTPALSAIHAKPGILSINGAWFLGLMTLQGVLAGLLTAFVGPSLIAPDLSNGALPLYLSRPFSRTEYVLGKGSVLGSLIASVTLAPVLLCFVIQSSLMGFDWFAKNLYIAGGIVVGSLLLMAVLILLGLAMSAWVRWRIGAGALILGAFVAGKGFGAVINAVMRTTGGYYLDLQHLLATVAGSLFHDVPVGEPVSAIAAAFTLLVFCALLLLLINRKLRVCEVAG
jgi:ABC-2 type transport system permease protein